MRSFIVCCVLAVLFVFARPLHAQTLEPTVSGVTNTSFTLSWTTAEALNTQVFYGVGAATASAFNWTLSTSHSLTVSGLQPGTTYVVQAESSYFTDTVLTSANLSVTTTGSGGTQMSTPVISGVTTSGFTITWTTAQPLNSQVHYGIGNTNTSAFNWTLSTQHSLTVTGLQAGTQYDVQVESSYYTDPDLLGPAQTVTTTAAATSSPSSSTPSSTYGPVFTAASAQWLYSAPTGTGLNIASITGSMTFLVHSQADGWNYPVQYATGANGCTTFTDTEYYAYTDKYCVPIPTGGFTPSVGSYGANDGHLVVVNTATNTYYDFWELLVNSSGQPTSTNVGQIVSGNLATSNGTPGTTAAEITGLAGDIMPGELNCETCLQHALNVIVPSSMISNLVGTQAPAAKTDGTVTGAIFREGAKIRFDPSVDIDSLTGVSTAVKALMTALQQYGGVITDQTSGSTIAFYSALPSTPDLTGINQIGAHLYIYY